MTKIVSKENSALRQIAREVTNSEFGKPALKKVLSDMRKALDEQDDGVAIAAPQIGKSLRIFIISNKINLRTKQFIYINPQITNHSKETAWMEEGCLSVRWLYGKVKRYKKATIKALNEKGEMFTVGASNLLAQIFQHEVDHLEGILFIDKAKEVHDIPPPHNEKTIK